MTPGRDRSSLCISKSFDLAMSPPPVAVRKRARADEPALSGRLNPGPGGPRIGRFRDRERDFSRHAACLQSVRHAAPTKIVGHSRLSMIYPELFRQLEAVRWNMDQDIPWDQFDASLLSDEQAQTVKMNAITEWAALPATEMFLRDNRHDSDFCAFMSVWFFEEQKHSLVLMEYLRRFRPDLVPTEAELHAVRFDFDPAPALETLMLHFCGEIRLNHWYRRAAEWHSEPVIRVIYETLARCA